MPYDSLSSTFAFLYKHNHLLSLGQARDLSLVFLPCNHMFFFPRQAQANVFSHGITVEFRNTGPESNGNPPVMNVTLYSLQVISLFSYIVNNKNPSITD